MYTIGKLARKVQVNPDSIRFYERQGLIAATMTTDSGYKLYTDETVRRITFIKHARRCGFSLAEISQLLHMDSGEPSMRSAAYRLAAVKQAELDQTIEALRTMAEALSCMLEARESDERDAVPFERSALMNALTPGLTSGWTAQ
jgi:MerR family Zn(II)-responsive transcriptional regulator of zntA